MASECAFAKAACNSGKVPHFAPPNPLFVTPDRSLEVDAMSMIDMTLQPVDKFDYARDLTRLGFAMLKYKANAAPYTHLLMSGGKYCIPQDFEETFLQEYAKEWSAGRHNYFIECRTNVFRMLADIDADDDHEWTEEDVLSMVKPWQEIMSQLFPDMSPEQLRVTTATTKHKLDKDGAIKNGVHLVWPELWVDTQRALVIAQVVLQHFERTQKRAQGRKSWHEVIDACVYDGNGLRMIGAYKHAPCKTCKKQGQIPVETMDGNKVKVKCPRCRGNRCLEERDRVYLVQYILDGRGQRMPEEEKLFLDDAQYMISQTSIRDTTRARESVKLSNMPQWFSSLELTKQTKVPQLRKAFKDVPELQKHVLHEKGSIPSGSKDSHVIDIGSSTFSIIDRLITSLPNYRDARITRVSSFKTRDGTPMFVALTNSNFCLNKGSNHESEHIYFWIFADGIKQRCFCRCPTERKHGLCSKFTSAAFPISDAVRVALFPNSVPTHDIVDTSMFEVQRAPIPASASASNSSTFSSSSSSVSSSSSSVSSSSVSSTERVLPEVRKKLSTLDLARATKKMKI
jgi:hypothetical protein